MTVLRVLLVEDDPVDTRTFCRHLARSGVSKSEISTFDRLEPALAAAESEAFDVLLLDLHLPDSTGVQTVERAIRAAPNLPIVAMTSSAAPSMEDELVRIGAEEYVSKDGMDSVALYRAIRFARERKARQKRLVDDRLNRVLAGHGRDELTGLPGRASMTASLVRFSTRSFLDKTHLAAVLIDIDDLSVINHRHGAAAGDETIVRVAHTLQSAFRPGDEIARVGENEFLAILPETTVDEARLLTERLQDRLAIPGESRVRSITVSAGIVEVFSPTMKLDDVLAMAQVVLRRSKAAGKNRVAAAHEPALLGEIDQLMDRLLRGQGLGAAAQPIVDLTTRAVVGHEMLCRVDSQWFGQPDVFLRVAESRGELTLVDRECLRAAARAAPQLRNGSRLHLNVFPDTLIQTPTDDLLSILSLAERTPCLELNEAQIVGDATELDRPIARLRKHGVTIALDDVGFGRSSLETLICLEPEVVKLDRRLVDGIAHDAVIRKRLRRMSQVVQTLGSEIIAEGIETEADLAVLIDLGIELGQGYLLGRPTPVSPVPNP